MTLMRKRDGVIKLTIAFNSYEQHPANAQRPLCAQVSAPDGAAKRLGRCGDEANSASLPIPFYLIIGYS